MKPAECSLCKSKLKEGYTEFTVHIEDQVIVLTDVPAWKCVNCDESYFNFDTSKKIDNVIEKVKNRDYLAKPIAAGEISLANV
ncbi:MAG: type II toxin-antitoxin system MqsA family antitoxin [Candidatus Kariarchaeaceae archaeon]